MMVLFLLTNFKFTCIFISTSAKWRANKVTMACNKIRRKTNMTNDIFVDLMVCDGKNGIFIIFDAIFFLVFLFCWHMQCTVQDSSNKNITSLIELFVACHLFRVESHFSKLNTTNKLLVQKNLTLNINNISCSCAENLNGIFK